MNDMNKYDQAGYALNVGISLDKLGNSISGGSHKITISARTGKHANEPGPYKTYWELQEAIINFAFLPVDGPDHCFQAYNKEIDDAEHMRHGNKLVRGILSIIVLPSCIIIGVVLRIFKAIQRVSFSALKKMRP